MVEPSSSHISHQYPIVLFDGVCNLCHGTVRFIIKRDPKGQFRFASLQSEVAQKILAELGQTEVDLNSVLLVQNGAIYRKSDAALGIAAQLNKLWPCLQMFKIVPAPLRNAVYDFIGSHRYQWFGQRDSCDISSLTEDVAGNYRFLHKI